MSTYIVKVSPDEDLYVGWSDTTESPHIWGTRKYLEDNPKYCGGAEAARFERANRTGTSADWPNWPKERMPYRWGDEQTFVYQQQGILRRCNLRAMLDRFEAKGEDADMCDLLEAFEGLDRPNCRRKDCTWRKDKVVS